MSAFAFFNKKYYEYFSFPWQIVLTCAENYLLWMVCNSKCSLAESAVVEHKLQLNATGGFLSLCHLQLLVL